MKHLRIAIYALAGTAAVAGCADDPARPDARARDVAYSVAARTTGNQLVVFTRRAIPSGFAERVAALGGKVEQAQAEFGEAVVSGLGAAAIDALRTHAGVSMIEPEGMLSIPEVTATWPAAADAVPASVANPEIAFFFPRQWDLRAIHADDAWAAGFLGSPEVTVAILDTGIGYLHTDLVGLVDLSRSASFIPEDDELVATIFPDAHPIADLHYHGTHAAATVASRANAAAGVTSQTTLIGVKVCSVLEEVGCPYSAILEGMAWAVEQGADIINLSAGGLFPRAGTKGFGAVLARAFEYAYEMGVTVVVSAGNNAINLDRDYLPGLGRFPSLYAAFCNSPDNLCVSATGPASSAGIDGPWQNVDAWTDYTNYGRSAIDFAAPGGTAAGGVWAACSPFSIVVPVCQTGTYAVGLTGTSMAAPHVAGLAAMLMGEYGHLAPAAVRNQLIRTADDLGARGTDPYYGKGRINAAKALGVD